jgi:hypothetical protein
MRVSLRRAIRCIELVQRDVVQTGINMKMKQPVVGVLEDRTGILETLTAQDGLKLFEGPAVHDGWLLLRFSLGEKFLHVYLMCIKVLLMTLDLMMLVCYALDVE